ncbi:MAG: hypothetical protein MI919_20060, partial [Holophagales bacterium]|nr:hypothetical protein [Holophagales bacterium]
MTEDGLGTEELVSEGAHQPELLRRRYERAQRLGHHITRLPRPDSPPIQRYSLEREPTSKKLYSVSDGKALVTGMETPNHELYVDNPTKIGHMNNAAADSPLEFFSEGQQTLFQRAYRKVGLRFQTARYRGPQQRQDTQELYEKAIVPRAKEFRENLLGKKLSEIEVVRAKSSNELDPESLGPALQLATKKLELFKKVVLSELASDPEAAPKALPDAQTIVKTAESGIYSREARQVSFSDVIQELSHLFDEDVVTHDLPRTAAIRDTMAELWQALDDLWKALPANTPVDLMSFHSANFQAEQIEMLESDNKVLLYRACDVMASTLLGNQVRQTNRDRIEAYFTQHDRRAVFHYSTQLASDGADWVSLESFAASDRDRQVTGFDESIGDQDSYKNIDNTWQYIMYGSIAGPETSLSDQDRSFVLYTRLRYLLKGVDKAGGYNPDPRAKLERRALDSSIFERVFPKESPSSMLGKLFFTSAAEQAK